MSFAFRQFLILATAMLVLVMGVQSVLDMPHDFAPSDIVAHDLAQAAPAVTPLEDDGPAPSPVEGELPAPQHEHEANVDHAMIAPESDDAAPALAMAASARAPRSGLPTGLRADRLERPPRAALAV